MAILSRPKISPQQRFDLEEWEALLSSLRSDSKLYTKQFLSNQNYILKGFSVSGIGLANALVSMADATLILPAGNFDFSYFISAPSEADITVADASLTDAARNYLEIQLTTQDGVPLTKAFWDPDANSGEGLEFNQIVNTITDIRVSITTSIGGFSGSVDTLPLAIVDVDGSGNITGIFDRRELFFRLSRPNDLDNEFSWSAKNEPPYALTLTGTVGTFEAGEPVTIGGETAEVLVGGSASITIKEPTGINFQAGSTITGGTSGATATIATVLESFAGVDKSIGDFKESIDAVMTELKLIKGTRFWYDTGFGSISGIQNLIASRLVDNPAAFGPSVSWDGSNIEITDDAAAPTDNDVLAYLRIFNSSDALSLTRQDKGLEKQSITFSAEPDAGSFTVDFDGDVSDPISYSASAAEFQAAWDAQIAESVTITGNFVDGFIITFDSVGDKILILENSNSLEADGVAVTTTITEEQKGQASDESIAIADQEILFIKKPASGSRIYDGLGSGDTNYQIASLGSYVNNDENYWIAYREGGKLYLRSGEVLSAGEATVISGGDVPAALLGILGLASSSTPPTYTSNIRGEQSESFVKRMSTNTDAIGDAQEDRSAFLRSDEFISWDGSQLVMINDIVLEILNTKNGTSTSHIIEVANSPISIGNGESIYVKIDRDISETVSIVNSGVTPIPAQSQDNKDIFVLFTRVDTAGALSVLHIPLHKQALDPGQTVRLGASGSGGGSGDSNSFAETLKNRLIQSSYNAVTPMIGSVNEDTLLDGASTASYEAADGVYLFDTIGQNVTSIQMLNAAFLADPSILTKVELMVQWNLDAIETAGTYEVSRNGGNEYQEVTMERVGDSDTFTGSLEFAAESANDSIQSQPTVDANSELDASTILSLGERIALANASILRNVTLEYTKTGSPQGYFQVKIVAEDGSEPSANAEDLYFTSSPMNIASLASGSVDVSLSELALPAGNYYLVIETSADYKNSHSGSDYIEFGQVASGSTTLQSYNGTIWAAVGTASLALELEGIELDLRFRITSVTDDVELKAVGIFYDLATAIVNYNERKREVFHFQAVADNLNEFTLTSFVPNPDFLSVYYIEAGQVYKAPAFSIQGQTVVFAEDQFNNEGVEVTVTLVFDQNTGGAFDNSDLNALLLAENHLGSSDPSLDKSVSGRGIFLRRPDGTLRELIINDSDEVEIWSID